MTCKYKGCRSEKIRARGYCGTHYNKLREAGAFATAAKPARTSNADLDAFLLAEVAASNFAPSVRNLYYRAVAQGLIEKDSGGSRNNYNRIVARCADVRLDGRLGWHELVDESREAHEWGHGDNSDESPQDVMLSRLDDWVSEYHVNPWHEKPIIAEVWVESRSLAQALQPLCRALRVDLVPLGGQPSWAFIYGRVGKIRSRGVDTHILCLTDYDKSGLEIAKNARKKADYFSTGRPQVSFERIALTEEQIDAYELPTGQPNAQSRKNAPWITRTCECEAMRIDDMAALVARALSPYITHEDIGAAYQKELDLNRLTNEIKARLRDVVQSEDEPWNN